MDSLALQVVPNPNGNYPLSKYTSVMGTPGLTAFVGSEGIIKGKEVCCVLAQIFDSDEEPFLIFFNTRVKPSSCRLELLRSAGKSSCGLQ